MSLCGKDLGAHPVHGWIMLCGRPTGHEGGCFQICNRYHGDVDSPETDPKLFCSRQLDHTGPCEIDDVPEDQRPLIVGLLKVRNELVREGNLYRCLANMMEFCDTIVACDDASTDGTDLVLREFFVKHGMPISQILFIRPEDQDFRKELAVKERMLHRIHKLKPYWIWWQDADEVLPDPTRLRDWLLNIDDDPVRNPPIDGYRFPYIQLWREGWWSRIDDGFADGKFVKLWRWRSDLTLDHGIERTHHMQFPRNLNSIVDVDIPVIHFGNWGKNLQWKCIQYWGGLGGVPRHMDFEQAEYQHLDRDWAVYPHASYPGKLERESAKRPAPFTEREKTIIKAMRNLKGLREWFTVVIPTYNRAEYLSETIASLKRQRYQQWIALVLDDGSTDRTPELMRRIALHDPRIFYARHPKRGAVAMNEIGMRFACEATEWWTRLGSDDRFEPNKLLLDAQALRQGEWCYGPFRVLRDAHGEAQLTLPDGRVVGLFQPDWQLGELCNRPMPGKTIVDGLLAGQFHVSWANIAVRTSVLRTIHMRYGNFCPPELVNMEDFVVNARIARVAGEPVFRGQLVDDGLMIFGLAAGHSIDEVITQQEQLAHDAIWRVNPIGASASTDTTSRDDALSREIIMKESGHAR